MESSVKYFSVIEYVQKLRKAKFNEEQAEAVAEIMEQQSYVVQEQLAKIHEQTVKIQEQSSKISMLESKNLTNNVDLAQIEYKLELKIEQLRVALIKWMLAIGTGGVLAIAGLLKYMIH